MHSKCALLQAFTQIAASLNRTRAILVHLDTVPPHLLSWARYPHHDLGLVDTIVQLVYWRLLVKQRHARQKYCSSKNIIEFPLGFAMFVGILYHDINFFFW